MNLPVDQALELLAQRGHELRERLHLPWPETVQQAVYRLRLDRRVAQSRTHRPAAVNGTTTGDNGRTDGSAMVFTAVVGGASSGKSTVFNNLLGGRPASRVAAWGHTTLGPLLAVHENRRELVETWLDNSLLLPTLRSVIGELDGDAAGEASAVTVVYHTVDALCDALLTDLPDFTSQAAAAEGDIAMSLLPWFDRLIVLVDHERWFDRQSISKLRTESAGYGQQRWVLFNRTQEGALGEEDRAALAQQAQRLEAAGMTILEFRRGRGFRQFPPGTLDGAYTFLSEPVGDRREKLTARITEAAHGLVNQNVERTGRLEELRASLEPAFNRCIPSARECLTALMTPNERRRTEVVARILRIHETQQWLAGQARQFRAAMRRVPLVGVLVGSGSRSLQSEEAGRGDRAATVAAFFEAAARREALELSQLVEAGSFWEEIRRWTDLKARALEFRWTPALRARVEEVADEFDVALQEWLTAVDVECQGISPHIKGALGAGTIGLAIVLLSVPGPLAALTLLSAKGAIAGALTELMMAAGAGALLGKPLGRLSSVIQERLIGSAPLRRVHAAAEALQELIRLQGRKLCDAALDEAASLVLKPDDPLLIALESIGKTGEKRA